MTLPVTPRASPLPLPAPAAAGPSPATRAGPACPFRVVLGESGDPPAVGAPATAGARPPPAPLPAGPLDAPHLRRAVAHLVAGERAVDRGLAMAMSGRQMSTQELIALQARVLEYSQELDVASRLVERATGAVKQVVSTQV